MTGSGRIRFHVALAGGLLPGLSLFLSLGLALFGKREDRPWFGRTWALVAVDLLVALALLTLDFNAAAPAPEAKDRRIGVRLEGGTRIGEVVPGSPAERAGILAGDEIRTVDGGAVSNLEELAEALNRGKPGTACRLTFVRGSETREIEVVPEEPGARELGLFEPVPGRELRLGSDLVLPYVPLLVVILGLRGLTAWTRGPKIPVWRPVVSVLLLSFAGSLGTALLLREWSLAAVLFMLLAQTAVMLGTGLAVWKWMGRVPEPEIPRLPPVRAILLGVLYLVAGALRLGILVAALNQRLLGGEGPESNPVGTLMQMNLGPLGTALLVASVVVLGPLAEEILFRGILLPRLAASRGVAVGLWGSAVTFGLMHPHYALGVVVVIYYGWVLGWARLRTGGLVAPMALHMTINGVVTLLALALKG